MKTKLKLVVSLACLSAVCLGAAACKDPTKDEEMAEKGYVIAVTYDPNGGKFLNREGITVKDYFNPDVYGKETDGSVSIKLLEPTDPNRPTSGLDRITLSRQSYTWVGWYQNREVVTNDNGDVVDYEGNVLELKEDGSYVQVKDGKELEALPAYTYSGLWNFETDTLNYNAEDYKETDGRMSMTLYAGWVPYYEFQYYYETNEGWELEGTTNFDYEKSQIANSDINTIWMPEWSDGAMNYTHAYYDNSQYTFPRKDDTTFVKAYTDSDCTQEITTSFVHPGTLDVEKGTAINRVQKIYVKAEEGEQYRITRAEQIVNNVNLNGYYEIQADLDFSDLDWPSSFSIGTFTGKFYGAGGTAYTISNAKATVNNEGAQYGGLFGYIEKGAVVQDLVFENATVDLVKVNGKSSETAFGLFAADIDDEANVSNITVGGTLKIGSISPADGWKINLKANGNSEGVTATDIKLKAYGMDMGSYYTYTFNYLKLDQVQISESGDVTGLEFKISRDREPNDGMTLEFALN